MKPFTGPDTRSSSWVGSYQRTDSFPRQPGPLWKPKQSPELLWERQRRIRGSTLLSVWEKDSTLLQSLSSHIFYFKIHVPVCMVRAYNPVFIKLGQTDLNFKAVLHSASPSQTHRVKFIRHQLDIINFRDSYSTYRRNNALRTTGFRLRRIIEKSTYYGFNQEICQRGPHDTIAPTGMLLRGCVC